MQEAKKNIVYVDAELEPIIPRFLEIRQEDIRNIRKALEEKDYATITRIGHTIKGSGGGYGFDAVSEIGKTIEMAGETADPETIEKMTNHLSDYLATVEIIYEKV